MSREGGPFAIVDAMSRKATAQPAKARKPAIVPRAPGLDFVAGGRDESNEQRHTRLVAEAERDIVQRLARDPYFNAAFRLVADRALLALAAHRMRGAAGAFAAKFQEPPPPTAPRPRGRPATSNTPEILAGYEARSLHKGLGLRDDASLREYARALVDRANPNTSESVRQGKARSLAKRLSAAQSKLNKPRKGTPRT